MKLKKSIVFSFLLAFMFLFSTSTASAAVMWGKTELKKGQIGKVTILSDVSSYKIVNSNSTQPDKTLKKGGEYRVYSYKVIGNQSLYGLGGGLFVQKSTKIKYETPSKAKLALLKAEEENNNQITIENLLKEVVKKSAILVNEEGYHFGIMDGNYLTAWLGYQGTFSGGELWGSKINITSNNTATFTYQYFNDENTTYKNGVLKIVNDQLQVTYEDDGELVTLTFPYKERLAK